MTVAGVFGARPRGRLYKWLSFRVVGWGLASAATWGYSDGVEVVGIKWRGKRISFLNWPRQKWACVLKYHHWPTPWTIAFGMCGKCIPWPCCGAITQAHAPDCTEEI